jgi:hypothetical protein
MMCKKQIKLKKALNSHVDVQIWKIKEKTNLLYWFFNVLSDLHVFYTW